VVDARAEFVAAFRTEGAGKDNYIDVTHWDAMQQLEKLVGKEVHILAPSTMSGSTSAARRA